MAGNRYNEFSARTILKIIEATKDIVGHIIKTVQHEVIILIKKDYRFRVLQFFWLNINQLDFPIN